MLHAIKQQILDTLSSIGVDASELSFPPNPEMGDFAFPCFELAKKVGKNPVDTANELVGRLNEMFIKEEMMQSSLVSKVNAFGPYVNFFLDERELASFVLSGISDNYGTHDFGNGKQVLIEFGCPNPMKVFHLGHLKNLITGEAVVRIFENAGYDVVRVNYQGDVGMHIAKVLWGILHGDTFGASGSWDVANDKIIEIGNLSLEERIAMIGNAYSEGANVYEIDGEEKAEILRLNEMVYEKDPVIQAVYKACRHWSLEYFDTIYKKLDSRFDKMYFESDTYVRGVELVEKGKEKGIFRESDGAIIFSGSEYGLHDRVFLNSKGYPTYEGKELALAERHFSDFDPYLVIHVVGKEQTGYFQVVFKALEVLIPKTIGREYHLVGGYLQLKGNQKMSSRSGNVVSGDVLINEIEFGIRKILFEREHDNYISEETIKKITSASVKYATLKSNVSEDVAFDMEETVSISGDSGPYLLYIVARINSILSKKENNKKRKQEVFIPSEIHVAEKALLLLIARYPEVTRNAVESYDPSCVAKYTFNLAQSFNAFYTKCPVLGAREDVRVFRLVLIEIVRDVMVKGLSLLGIEAVDKM